LSWNQSVSQNVAYNTVACGKKSGGPYNAFTYKSGYPITSYSRSPVPKGTWYCVTYAYNAQGKTGGASNEAKAVVP
jgi:hypothetical protein